MPTAAYRLPALAVEEHAITVPLDHFGDEPGELEVFARIVGTPGEAKPYLLYLQGGPGSEAFRPTAAHPAWLPRALRDYRVIMLDQRGTGRSSPVGRVDGRFHGTGGAQDTAGVAARLRHYRADAIVEDAEALRRALGIERWAVLGQSFGGFTALCYLAAHPAALDLALFTGGLPRVVDERLAADGLAGPGGADPDVAHVYRVTWETMRRKSQGFCARFPADAQRLERLAERAAESGIALPGGIVAGPEHIRSLGHVLGTAHGAQTLHYLLDFDPDTAAFRHDAAAALPFSARNPVYAVLQESCWANGVATDWGAVRARPAGLDSTWLAGEHIHPGLLASGDLAPWAEVAQALAERPWPLMWDPGALRTADVPAIAAVYFDDAYVPREFSLATAALLPHARTWVTSEYEHDGLRASGAAVLDRLLAMAAGDA
ncbi:alpha/beta fold hydrolase [Brevibacterium sp. BRM-1]|uniref:alpha/beta fold hydrolase n=1 Tax=Brevibacterium sp. BRM-1 TaxID=2999062 RepID=UPI002280C40F|nr:alpha/beta fold hydrolase [Brevibacterium sp. BRM-1]WAL41353.1 alpha/beta fold hydrolase [Brevibacterium sp. BRM-1]